MSGEEPFRAAVASTMEQLKANDPGKAVILMNAPGIEALLTVAHWCGMPGLPADIAKLARKGVIAIDRNAPHHNPWPELPPALRDDPRFASGSATAEGESE